MNEWEEIESAAVNSYMLNNSNMKYFKFNSFIFEFMTGQINQGNSIKKEDPLKIHHHHFNY